MNHSTAYPTSTNLKDLAENGETFLFTRKTGELNQALQDLIQKHDYDVNLEVKPIGNAFEITGKISTELDILCSRCGRDMILPIEDKFNELILVMDERPRAGHSGHTGGQFENGPFCNYTTSHMFSLADFVHEHIAAAEPYKALCHKPDCEEFFQKAQANLDITENEPIKSNPFATLKDLQLKKS